MPWLGGTRDLNTQPVNDDDALFCSDPMRHRRGRTRRHDARLPARPRRRAHPCSKSTATSSATFAATRSTRRPARDGRAGLLEPSSQRPHQRLEIDRRLVRHRARPARRLPRPAERYAFIALMPQWDFLDFLAGGAQQAAGIRSADAGRGHRADRGRRPRPRGARHDARRATSRSAPTARSAATAATRPCAPRRPRRRGRRRADRRALVSRRAATRPSSTTAWPRHARSLRRHHRSRRLLAVRVHHPKGGADALSARRLEAFRAAVVAAAPLLAAHIETCARWDDVKLLTVSVDRLTQWSKPGLLCIGDAAHAMSPIGGVGINLAIQERSPPRTCSPPVARRHGRATATLTRCAGAACGRPGHAGGAGRDPGQRPGAGDERRERRTAKCRCRSASSPRCRRCSISVARLLGGVLLCRRSMGARPPG